MRFLDIILAFFGLLVFCPLLLVIFLLGYIETGSPLFIQERLGQFKVPFFLVKFRTMHIGTESKATHLVAASSLTNFGRFLRRSKLDELPQLWNVLIGEMSFVGPRPCLPNQTELITERNNIAIFNAKPGITGLAQIHGVDMSSPKFLAKIDARMLKKMSICLYFYYIFKTIMGSGSGDRVRSL